jgi:hypothetical protein
MLRREFVGHVAFLSIWGLCRWARSASAQESDSGQIPGQWPVRGYLRRPPTAAYAFAASYSFFSSSITVSLHSGSPGVNLPGKGVDHPACDGLTGLRHGYPVERVVLLFAVFNLPQYFDILRSSGDLAA